MGRKGKAEAEASPAKGTPAESEVEKAEEQKETKEPKAKAKSKAKEKAKAKSVTKQLKKKPSMKEVPKTKEEKAGGKKESLMDKTKAWETLGKKQDPDGEETENEEDDQEDNDEPGDHGKARKFRKMSDAEAIPAHILDLIHEQSKKASNPRKEKSSLVNNLFKQKKAFFTRFVWQGPGHRHAQRCVPLEHFPRE